MAYPYRKGPTSRFTRIRLRRAGELSRSAYAYAEKHVGPRERVGNKGGTLGNRLRAVMAGKK